MKLITKKNNNKNKNKNNKKKTQLHKKIHTVKIIHQHNKNETYKIVRLDKLDAFQYKTVSRIIIEMKKNDRIPLLGYWTPILFNMLRMEGKTYIIYEKNVVMGIVLFKNLTYDFKSKILGKQNVSQFKSKADVSTYLLHYSLIYGNMNKALMDNILNIFIHQNNLQNKNFIVSLFLYLNYNDSSLEIYNKYKPFIDFMFNGKKEYEKLGFIYNGYHLTMHKEIFNVFTKRYIKELFSDDFYNTYIITRQLEYYNVNTSNLKMLYKNETIYPLINLFRFCIENSIVYYTNTIYNQIYSIYKSVPYEFQFITNYIVNELGNINIICNYLFLNQAMNEFYGENSKECNAFPKIIKTRDEIIKLLDKKHYLFIRNFYLSSYSYVFYNQYNDKDKFLEFIDNQNKNNQNNQNHNGLIILDFTLLLNRIPLHNDYSYNFSKLLVFTYINNEFKAYTHPKNCGILIGEYKFLDLYNKPANEISDFIKISIFPDDYPSLTKEPISEDAINIIDEKMVENCKNIARMYEKHVCLEPSQINGYKAIHVIMCPIKVGNEYKVLVLNTSYYALISNRANLEQCEWYNEIAIKPALYKGYKTERTEAQFQPLDLS